MLVERQGTTRGLATGSSGLVSIIAAPTESPALPQALTTLSTATSVPSAAAGSSSPAPSPTSTGSNMPTNAPAKSNVAPAAAGAAIGGIIVGVIVGSVIAFILLKKRHRRKVEALERQVDSEKYSGDSASPPALMYVDPAVEKDLKDSKARIKALEVERNAASAFGDKLDGKTEQELLDSSAFGLSVYNEKIDQLAMSLSVSASGLGPKHEVDLPSGIGAGAEALKKLGKKEAHNSFEKVVCHVVNSVMLERVCIPFCFVAAEENKGKSMNRISKDVSKQYDQAMFARWRSMSHAGLRKGCKDASGKAAVSAVQQDVFNALAEAMVWAGMEIDIQAAVIKVSKVHARVGEAATTLSKLMNVIREEMTTANFEPVPVNGGLTKSLGLSASTAGSEKSRLILAAK